MTPIPEIGCSVQKLYPKQFDPIPKQERKLGQERKLTARKEANFQSFGSKKKAEAYIPRSYNYLIEVVPVAAYYGKY